MWEKERVSLSKGPVDCHEAVLGVPLAPCSPSGKGPALLTSTVVVRSCSALFSSWRARLLIKAPSVTIIYKRHNKTRGIATFVRRVPSVRLVLCGELH
jgi:hypothetical protein